MGSQRFEALREAMVRTQIEARGIADERVLAAMRAVPRECFVPAEMQHEAYADRALAIGLGQTISQPYMVAVMTASLRLAPTDRVLEIGTGSGYQAAVLARIAREVVTIERHPRLAADARARLDSLGVTGVTILVGDGTEGHPPGAPYDAVLVTAGAPRVPDALRAQLGEGGRLVIPVGGAWHQDLLVIVRSGDDYRTSTTEGCVFVPLIGRDGWPG